MGIDLELYSARPTRNNWRKSRATLLRSSCGHGDALADALGPLQLPKRPDVHPGAHQILLPQYRKSSVTSHACLLQRLGVQTGGALALGVLLGEAERQT